jgi:hypothetical protein
MQWSSLQQRISKFMPKNFYDSDLRGRSLNTILAKILPTHFCKLDHFTNISNICCIALKRSSLQERVSKFTPKKVL